MCCISEESEMVIPRENVEPKGNKFERKRRTCQVTKSRLTVANARGVSRCQGIVTRLATGRVSSPEVRHTSGPALCFRTPHGEGQILRPVTARRSAGRGEETGQRDSKFAPVWGWVWLSEERGEVTAGQPTGRAAAWGRDIMIFFRGCWPASR